MPASLGTPHDKTNLYSSLTYIDKALLHFLNRARNGTTIRLSET